MSHQFLNPAQAAKYEAVRDHVRTRMGAWVSLDEADADLGFGAAARRFPSRWKHALFNECREHGRASQLHVRFVDPATGAVIADSSAPNAEQRHDELAAADVLGAARCELRHTPPLASTERELVSTLAARGDTIRDGVVAADGLPTAEIFLGGGEDRVTRADPREEAARRARNAAKAAVRTAAAGAVAADRIFSVPVVRSAAAFTAAGKRDERRRREFRAGGGGGADDAERNAGGGEDDGEGGAGGAGGGAGGLGAIGPSDSGLLDWVWQNLGLQMTMARFISGVRVESTSRFPLTLCEATTAARDDTGVLEIAFHRPAPIHAQAPAGQRHNGLPPARGADLGSRDLKIWFDISDKNRLTCHPPQAEVRRSAPASFTSVSGPSTSPPPPTVFRLRASGAGKVTLTLLALWAGEERPITRSVPLTLVAHAPPLSRPDGYVLFHRFSAASNALVEAGVTSGWVAAKAAAQLRQVLEPCALLQPLDAAPPDSGALQLPDAATAQRLEESECFLPRHETAQRLRGAGAASAWVQWVDATAATGVAVGGSAGAAPPVAARKNADDEEAEAAKNARRRRKRTWSNPHMVHHGIDTEADYDTGGTKPLVPI